MFKRNLWKIVLSLAITGWAVAELMPLRDVPFPEYVKGHATAKTAEFGALVDRAAAMKKSGAAPSEFVALKEIGVQDRIDLSQYFPNVNLERLAEKHQQAKRHPPQVPARQLEEVR